MHCRRKYIRIFINTGGKNVFVTNKSAGAENERTRKIYFPTFNILELKILQQKEINLQKRTTTLKFLAKSFFPSKKDNKYNKDAKPSRYRVTD